MPVLPGAEPFAHDGGPVGVLLCHGFTGTPQSLRPWARSLADAGLTVRLPRLPGHGTTWQAMNRTRWEDWFTAVEGELADLRKRCERVVVGGLSMGGALAARLAQRHPDDVAGLVLVNPSLLTERLDAKMLPLLARITPSWAPIASDIKKAGITELAYPKLPTRAMMQLRQLWVATRADLGRIAVPLLMFRSRVDHVVEPASGKALLAGVASTDATEIVLEDSFHVATLDNDAPMIFERSVAWIRERTPAAEPR